MKKTPKYLRLLLADSIVLSITLGMAAATTIQAIFFTSLIIVVQSIFLCTILLCAIFFRHGELPWIRAANELRHRVRQLQPNANYLDRDGHKIIARKLSKGWTTLVILDEDQFTDKPEINESIILTGVYLQYYTTLLHWIILTDDFGGKYRYDGINLINQSALPRHSSLRGRWLGMRTGTTIPDIVQLHAVNTQLSQVERINVE